MTEPGDIHVTIGSMVCEVEISPVYTEDDNTFISIFIDAHCPDKSPRVTSVTSGVSWDIGADPSLLENIRIIGMPTQFVGGNLNDQSFTGIDNRQDL